MAPAGTIGCRSHHPAPSVNHWSPLATFGRTRVLTQPCMRRTYLQAAGMAATGVAATGFLALLLPNTLAARGIFESKPLAQDRFAVLAQPVGRTGWKLLVLEQIKRKPLCWRPRADGLVEPTLNSFNFAGICSRYLDSNGYSLRSGGSDLGWRFRLRVMQRGSTLQLQAFNPDQKAPIVVGRAPIPRRQRNGFVRLKLNDDWQLERRAYQGRTLSHLYFANPDPIQLLMARAIRQARGSSMAKLGPSRAPSMPPPIPPSLKTSRGSSLASRLSSVQRGASAGPIPLQVSPYKNQR